MTSPTNTSNASSPVADALQDMFSLQSGRLTVPNTRPNDLVGEPLLIATTTVEVRRSRAPLVLAAAASIVLALAFVGLARGGEQPNEPSLAAVSIAQDVPSDSTGPGMATTEPAPATPSQAIDYVSLLKPYRFDTKSIRLAADEIQLTYDEETFDYSMTVYLDSAGMEMDEPMNAGVFGIGEEGTRENTSLRLMGNNDRIPVLVEFDFESDGTDWWASEIRTSYGGTKSDWIRETGEFFRSPLGTTFSGDLTLTHLRMTGLEVLAFKKPVACLVPKHSMTIGFHDTNATIYTGFNIDYWREPASTELQLQLFDSASCTPSAIDGLDIEVIVVDPTVFSFDTIVDHQEVGVFGLQLGINRAGGTRIEVLVRDGSGSVIAELTFTAQSHPVSDDELDDYLSYLDSETPGEG